MDAQRQSAISIIIAIVALLVSSVTLYFTFLDDIGVAIAVSPDIFVSNTIGGVPDAHVTLSIRADGPSTKSVLIQSAELIVENVSTKVTHKLVGRAVGITPAFPTFLEGGDTVGYELLFVVNDYVKQKVNRLERWFDQFASLIPEEVDEIEKIHERLKSEYLPVESHSDSEPDILEVLELLRRGASQDLEAPVENEDVISGEEIDEKISSFLGTLSVEDLGKVLFFTPGTYTVYVNILDPFGDVIASTQRRELSIDGVVSETLRHEFNTNVRVETRLYNTSSQ